MPVRHDAFDGYRSTMVFEAFNLNTNMTPVFFFFPGAFNLSRIPQFTTWAVLSILSAFQPDGLNWPEIESDGVVWLAVKRPLELRCLLRWVDWSMDVRGVALTVGQG